MQLAPRLSDPLGQAALDREMDILVGEIESEAPGGDFALDGLEAGDDPRRLGSAQQAPAREHPRMCNRAANIVTIEPAVERQRSGIGLDLGQARTREAPADKTALDCSTGAGRVGGSRCSG